MRRIGLATLYLVVVIALSGSISRAIEIDPTFRPQIQTSTYFNKSVQFFLPLPDGKMIVAGNFNNYNGTPVGGLIRLNADATLDGTFNNRVLGTAVSLKGLFRQPDGKIILLGIATFTAGGSIPRRVARLLPNGDLDTSFTNQLPNSSTSRLRLDANGRILVNGTYYYDQNGTTITKKFLRLNDDGSLDTSFNAPIGLPIIYQFGMQGNKLLYIAHDGIYRLNEDGSADSSFVPMAVSPLSKAILAQPDGKILVLSSELIRLSINGGVDPEFPNPLTFPISPRTVLLQNDGKIAVSGWSSLLRYLPDGTPDPEFATYQHSGESFYGPGLLTDGSFWIGDVGSHGVPTNRFTKLFSNGVVDETFNLGGLGFQHVEACQVRTIAVLTDGRILFAGAFDVVDGVARNKIALLRNDGTLDPTFAINMGPSGNYFSEVTGFYHAVRLSDGKILVSGNFIYRLNGIQKRNVVRLNSDGSIDPTFNLSVVLEDYSLVNSNVGTNLPKHRPDGKIAIGMTRVSPGGSELTPQLLDQDGTASISFSPSLFRERGVVAIFGLDALDDGKLLIAGRSALGNVGSPTTNRGFLARLNADGSTDSTFQIYEVPDVTITKVVSLSDEKILIISKTATDARILRLHPSGAVDDTFDPNAGAIGRLNAVAVMQDGRILVGGAFTAFAGQPRRNFAMLNADGTIGADPGAMDDEILFITFDNEGRVLIGGSFTSLTSGGQNVSAPYLTRFTMSPEQSVSTIFDYDGDGRTDFSVFRLSTGAWYLQRSNAGFQGLQFGADGDKLTPADFDGDGKTDIAVYRPAAGTWYILNSATSTVTYPVFGAAEDLPAPGDYDGDGKADLTVFRPSQGTWYRQNSSNGSFFGMQFGATGDVPTVGDFDGDGKNDLGIWRPSNGDWYNIRSSNGSVFGERFGQTGDKIAPADYDGDGKTDIAIYRPSTGLWVVRNSATATYSYHVFGAPSDVPVSGDYDGDGKADIGVWRPSDGTWYIQRSDNGQFIVFPWGQDGDRPTPSAYGN